MAAGQADGGRPRDTYTVTDPPLKLLRRFIPPLRLGGGVALDLSFFVLMIIVSILISIVTRL